MTNPLSPIMDWYAIIYDSLKVTGRVIRKEIPGAITPRHVFFRFEMATESLGRLEEANNELNDLIVLSLVASFERTLRDHVKQRPDRILGSGDPVDKAVHSEILKDIEYWRIADRLVGVFRVFVTPEHLGHVKQIVGYRNWVAHGRATMHPPDGNITPHVAYTGLTEFLQLAGIVDPS